MEDKKEVVLNMTIKKLGAVSFFADVASEMLYPITPIFLAKVLGASMTSIGLIEGCAEAAASLMKTYSGSLSDKISKRKPFVVIGYLLGAISKPLIGISTSWIHVLFARGIDRTGKGLRSAPRDALIADSVSSKNRGAAFGWHRSMDTLGAAVGPLLTVALISTETTNLRNLYFWALIPGFFSVLIAMTIKEKTHHVEAKAMEQKAWSLAEFSGSFKKYLTAWALFSLTNSSDVFLLMKAKSSGFSTTNIVLLYCAYNLTYAFSSPYLGKLSDHIPRKNLMVFGLVIFALVYVGFGISCESWHFWALFLLYGIYMGATDGVGKALAVDYSPKHLKATALGLLGTITGTATIMASTMAGLIWDYFGSSYTFFFGASGAALAIILLARLPKI